MEYYIAKKVSGEFNDVIARVTSALKAEGFGIITDIDVKNTLHNKLGVEFRPYRILGACNPGFALKALLVEDKVGVILPCNVVVQQTLAGDVEVAAMDPAAFMNASGNQELSSLAAEVRHILVRVLDVL